MTSQTEAIQRLEERVARVQAELTRDLASVRDSQARLERRINEIPHQTTRSTALPGRDANPDPNLLKEEGPKWSLTLQTVT